MFILLQHFVYENKAVVKHFNDIKDIEAYMNSNIIQYINHFDNYAGKSIMQRILTNSPDYTGVIGFIFNEDSNAIIYGLDIEKDYIYTY